MTKYSKLTAILRALLINTGFSALFFAGWELAFHFIALASQVPASRPWYVLVPLGALASLYISYRVAFWSLIPARFTSQKQALLTAVMVVFQAVVSYLLTAAALSLGILKQTGGAELQGDGLVMTIVSAVVFYSLFGLLIYVFAVRRASLKFEGFRALKSAQPHINPKLKPWMLIYGLVATFAGIGTIVGSVIDAVGGHTAALINLPTWTFYLAIYWLAYRGKTIGGSLAFWRLAIPAIITLDLAGIAALTNYAPADIAISAGLSLPLYIAAYWYGYVFLPGTRNKQIKHLKRDELFQ